MCDPYQEGGMRNGEQFVSRQALGFHAVEEPRVLWVERHRIVFVMVREVNLLFKFSVR
jgi:hypothetical protein